MFLYRRVCWAHVRRERRGKKNLIRAYLQCKGDLNMTTHCCDIVFVGSVWSAFVFATVEFRGRRRGTVGSLFFYCVLAFRSGRGGRGPSNATPEMRKGNADEVERFGNVPFSYRFRLPLKYVLQIFKYPYNDNLCSIESCSLIF